jgi:hypothetical protein
LAPSLLFDDRCLLYKHTFFCPEEKRLHGGPRRKVGDIVKVTDFKEIGCGNMDWICDSGGCSGRLS